MKAGELPSDSYHPRLKALHQRNASRLKEIIRAHCWPGISLVGEEASKAAWLVAQHSVSEAGFMAECVHLLEEAVAKDDAEGWQLAFLQDRVRTLMKTGGQHRFPSRIPPRLMSAMRALDLIPRRSV